MGLFGKSERQRIVVKEYGRNSFLAVSVPLIALLVGRQGMERRQQAQALEMEKDSGLMLNKGYRIVSSQQYMLPMLSISYWKVTYELIDPAG